jgi:putative transposon-encoded protein
MVKMGVADKKVYWLVSTDVTVCFVKTVTGIKEY